MEMRGTHADGNAQFSTSRHAVEGTLRQIAPGLADVLQQLQAKTFRHIQAVVAGFAVKQILFDGIDQLAGIKTQAAGQVFLAYQGAVAWWAIHFGIDDE